jgi:hypothetical protein
MQKATDTISISDAARSLKIPHSYLYGVFLAYGVTPIQGESNGSRGKPPKLITRATLDDVRRRLKAARSSK